jgi:hypothetical protein
LPSPPRHHDVGRRRYESRDEADLFFTTPMAHHNKQILTLTTKRRNEVPLPPATRAACRDRRRLGDARATFLDLAVMLSTGVGSKCVGVMCVVRR